MCGALKTSSILSSSTTARGELVRGPAAVDRQCNSSDRRRRFAREKDGERAEFIDRGKALVRLLREQDVADHLFARNAVRLGLAVDLRLDQRRVDVARAGGVAGDALFGGLQRGDFREADDAVLGGKDRKSVVYGAT